MKYLLLLTILVFPYLAFGQNYKGIIHEDHTISIVPSDDIIATPRQSTKTYQQIAGFPKGFRAFENNKNSRNVTLEDINNDGVQEILFAAGSTFIAMSKGEILWKKPMIGAGLYPPSIADIDNDGDMEIVQATGGSGLRGRLYAWDHTGRNLAGFPKSFNDNWILISPTLADLDGDRQLEIILLELNLPGGSIHIIKNDGTPWSKDWPLRLPKAPTITPSVGDIDNDGQKEIVVASTTTLYVFDLQADLEEGWPVDDPNTSFSYQSPLLVDLDKDGDLEIVGAAHGDIPQYYIYHHDGTPYTVWPFFVPEQSWTFTTPTIVKIADEYQILMSRPRASNSDKFDMLYSWDGAGTLKENYPIEKVGGLHGIISVANIDDDSDMELIFGSDNFYETTDFGFIHAFKTDGSGQLDGFPLKTRGWTILNGAALGDVDGDGQMDLTALGYTVSPEKTDSIFINVFNLEQPYQPDKILWTTYKGNNSRDGNMQENLVSNTFAPNIDNLEVSIFPNPVLQNGTIELKVEIAEKFSGDLYTSNGQLVQRIFDGNYQKGTYKIALPKLNTGLYFLKITAASNQQLIEKITVFSN